MIKDSHDCQYTKVHGGYTPCKQMEPLEGTLQYDLNNLNKAWVEFKYQLKLAFKQWWVK